MRLGDRKETLDEVLELLAAAADLVRRLDDPNLNAYVLPELEGSDGGWLGKGAVDYVREASEDEEAVQR